MKVRRTTRLCWVLLVLAVIIGIRFAAPLRRQQTAIAEFERLGGVVSLQNGGPDWLRRILGDKVMQLFSGVYLVNLSDSRVTDDDLANLQAMTEVERLNLARTRITDAGLAHLEGLANLAALDLSGTRVTDDGLVPLGKLTHLEFLYLDGTQVTDAGIRHLEGLTHLRQLSLEDTNVTDDGVASIRQELPSVNVSR